MGNPPSWPEGEPLMDAIASQENIAEGADGDGEESDNQDEIPDEDFYEEGVEDKIGEEGGGEGPDPEAAYEPRGRAEERIALEIAVAESLEEVIDAPEVAVAEAPGGRHCFNLLLLWFTSGGWRSENRNLDGIFLTMVCVYGRKRSADLKTIVFFCLGSPLAK